MKYFLKVLLIIFTLFISLFVFLGFYISKGIDEMDLGEYNFDNVTFFDNLRENNKN